MRDEALGLGKGLDRLFPRHSRSGTGFIVGDGLKVIGVGQKHPQIGPETLVIFRQALKFRMDGLYAF